LSPKTAKSSLCKGFEEEEEADLLMNGVERIKKLQAVVAIRSARFSELIADLVMVCAQSGSHSCLFVVHAGLKNQSRGCVKRNRRASNNKHIPIDALRLFTGGSATRAEFSMIAMAISFSPPNKLRILARAGSRQKVKLAVPREMRL
jgi:hypothetical protein